MAKRTVTKTAVITEYLAKHPDKGPKEIADIIHQEKRLRIRPKLISIVKSKLKHAGTAAPASATAASTAQAKPASAKTANIAQHIANLKAAARKLGNDEAKRIVDLF